jgi:hypothetical protein
MSARTPSRMMDHPLVGGFFFVLLILIVISWSLDSRG